LPESAHKIRPPRDFRICKLCRRPLGDPTCFLGPVQLFICSGCDFHYLNRLDPPADEASSCLTDSQLRYIDARLAANAHLLAARLRRVREFIDLFGRRCLDIGTGVGQFLQMLTDAGAEGVGVEPSSLRRAFALQRFGIQLHREPIEEPFWEKEKNAFDLITLWDVLEHVNDPVATIEAAFSLLKPGGWLFLETDNRDTATYRLSFLSYRLTGGRVPLFLPDFYRPIPYGHKQIFCPAQLYPLINRCGFDLIAAAPGCKENRRVKTLTHSPRGQIVLVAQKPVTERQKRD